jgi:hypothetical protein
MNEIFFNPKLSLSDEEKANDIKEANDLMNYLLSCETCEFGEQQCSCGKFIDSTESQAKLDAFEKENDF